MNDERRRLFVVAPALAALGCLIHVLVLVFGGAGTHLGFGFGIGTLFGQASLAGAWCVLGPLSLAWRVPLSLAWIVALTATLATPYLYGGPPLEDYEWLKLAASIGLMLLTQWALVQLVLWPVAQVCGLHIRHREEAREALQRRRRFSIRHLLGFTAAVAVLVGALRLVVVDLRFIHPYDLISRFGPSIFAGLVTLPLLVTELLPNRAAHWLLGFLALLVAATVCEEMYLRLQSGGPALFLPSMNGFAALWMLAFAALLRWCGYGLGARSIEAAPAIARC